MTVAAVVAIALVSIALLLVRGGIPGSPQRAAIERVRERLAGRAPLDDEQWLAASGLGHEVPLTFIAWFRKSASDAFGFDLGRALPSDRLKETLGLYTATWGDADMDLDSEFESQFDLSLPKHEGDRRERIFTLGDWAGYYWEHVVARDAEG